MKPKNKKILALLCLPVLVMSMVLPLCSFMPGLDDDRNIPYDYSPSYGLNVDVGVDVVLDGNGFFNNYTGYVYDVLNCTVNYDLEDDRIPFIAPYSDYVSSAYSSSLEFYVDDFSVREVISGVGFLIDYGVKLLPTFEFDEANEFSTSTYLNGRFNITYSEGSTITNFNNYVSIICYDNNAGYEVDLEDFYLDGTIYFSAIDSDGEIVYDKHIVNLDLLGNYNIDDYTYIDTYSLATAILSDYYDYTSFKVISFDFALLPFEYEDFTFSDYVGSCIISATIMPADFAKDLYFSYLSRVYGELYSMGFNTGYDDGYGLGYNAGVSSAPTVWKDLGTFLTSTVGSFLNTSLFPGFSISVILTVFVGAVLLIAFLKLFAGG